MKKGKLIVLDGTDGSGKATQVALLEKRAKQEGLKVKVIDFPQYKKNVHGKLLRECLDGKHGDFIGLDPRIASVIYAGDRRESSPQIKEWLDQGYLVVADRYVSANQIHQGGKIRTQKKRREFLNWLDHLEHVANKIPRPDLILYLHLPLELSISLIVERSRREKIKADLAEINARYLLESQQSALSIVREKNNWRRIDCANKDAKTMKTREEIHELIWEVVLKLVSKNRRESDRG